MSQRGGSGEDVDSLLSDLPFGGRQAAVFDKSLNVPASTPSENPEVVELEVPFDGVIPYVDLAWPSGSQSLAGVKVSTGRGFQLLPFDESDGFIANNDYANRFPLNFPLRGDETVRFEYANLDSTDHKVTVIVTLLETDGTR